MQTENLRLFAENEKDLQGAKAEVKRLEEKKKRLTELIVAEFSAEGTQSQKIKTSFGLVTVHLRRELWAGHAGEKQALCDALKACGYTGYVSEGFNVQSVTALAKELATDYHQRPLGELSVEDILEALPPEMRATMKLSEIFKVGMRGS